MKTAAKLASEPIEKLRRVLNPRRPQIKAFVPNNGHATPRHVDLIDNEDDNLACLLGAFGQSTAEIAKQTGLTEGQIIYRLTKGSVRRTDWRNGTSPIFEYVRDLAMEKARRKMNAILQTEGGLVIADART